LGEIRYFEGQNFAIELREDEREIFTELTGREREPLQRIYEFAAVIGRRGGKSRGMATLATGPSSMAGKRLSRSTGTSLPVDRHPLFPPRSTI
jgi:hypothetical protein